MATSQLDAAATMTSMPPALTWKPTPTLGPVTASTPAPYIDTRDNLLYDPD